MSARSCCFTNYVTGILTIRVPNKQHHHPRTWWKCKYSGLQPKLMQVKFENHCSTTLNWINWQLPKERSLERKGTCSSRRKTLLQVVTKYLKCFTCFTILLRPTAFASVFWQGGIFQYDGKWSQRSYRSCKMN